MYPLCGKVSHPTTAPCLKQHDIYQLYIIWITKGQLRRVMWALALQEIVMFTLLTTTPNTHTCWGGSTSACTHTSRRVIHQHTHVPEDNTSAHTRAGGNTSAHTRAGRGCNTSAHTRAGG